MAPPRVIELSRAPLGGILEKRSHSAPTVPLHQPYQSYIHAMDTKIEPTSNHSEKPLISVLIVNRNSARYLEKCLASLCQSRGESSIECVLVDAESEDDSVDVAKSLWPQIKVISVKPSLGYVKANNVGLAHVTGKYTMYLNSDTEVGDHCISALCDFLERNPDVGVVTARILNPDGTDQGVIRRFPSPMNGLFGRRSVLSRIFPNNRWYRAYMLSRTTDSRSPFETDIVSACSMVVPTELLSRVGGMNEKFRFYWVDAEMCGRLKQRGYKIMCVPEVSVMHHEGKGTSTDSFVKRLKMTVAFNQDAHLAYVNYHRISRVNPVFWLTGAALGVRTVAMLGLLCLRPHKATSSGGKN